jgi:hypothetical protein
MDPFSRRISAEILSTHPDWAVYSRSETWKGSDEYFVVEIAPPAASDTLPLRVSTWDDEVTVDFDYYHAHFERWMPKPGDTKFQSALLYVRALTAEELGAASWWDGDLCKLCGPYERGAPLQPPFSASFTRVRVRSWNGGFDVDV